MNPHQRRTVFALAATASIVALAAAAPALGQTPQSKPAGGRGGAAKDAAAAGAAERNLEQDIIVTGVVRKTRKLDTTFTIDTLDEEDIKRLAPISTADLLNNIPGFFAEGSTAGERSNNVTVRGLPSSGYRYAPQLIDGLPVYQDSDVPFANNDVFFSNDLMTDRVEVVKGGPGGILYSNGLGAIVNYVTKTGGDRLEGGYKLELATYDFIRNDFYLAGPITENLHFAIGGFYRTSGGLRDTGYTADKGGQIRGNLTYNSSDGTTNFGLYLSHLNDRTAVYNNLPIEVPGFTTPGTAENPIRIDNSTVRPIGIDFGDGTLLSPSTRYVTQIDDSGRVRTADLADGIHPVFTTITAKFAKELDSGWRFEFDANYTSGTAGFNALFAGNDAATAASFLANRWAGDVLQPAFDANFQAAEGTPNNAPFYNRNILATYFNALSPAAFDQMYRTPLLESGFSNFEQLRAQYGANQTIGGPGGYIGAFNTRNGEAIPAGSNLSFQIPWIVRSKLSSAAQNLKVQKEFELLGRHNLTFGAYHSTNDDNYDFRQSLTITTLASPSELVDLFIIDAKGNKVGPSLSLNGSYLPGFAGNAASGDAENFALFIQDHWEALDGRLRIDAGFRWETEKLSVRFQNRSCCTVFLPGNAETGNRAYTQVQTLGAPQFLNERYNGHGWSVGANYGITDTLAVYALASQSFRLPSFNDGVAFAQSAPLGDPVEHIDQYEGGVRFRGRVFDASATGFYNKFTPRTLINQYQDINAPVCTAGGTTATPATITSCPLIFEPYSFGTTNYGAELEFVVRPPFLPGFDLKANIVLQNPKVNGSSYTIVNQVGNSYAFGTVSQDGRREGRQATTTLNIQPRWDLKPVSGLPVKLYGQYEYRSARYSNSQDLNVTLYPSYYIINVGALIDLTDHLSIQFHIANLTNQLSFTEGDPLFFDLKAPNGNGNRGVARPLFGRTGRFMLNYRF
ncbi:outer membrane receptor protein involved in Fe transport [Sphingomonas zeicaulis]|uniref:TonB-dependent receptor n=1 Tax=Sphingomonas zeicaulis TaxID=1632740 RepID=UPI003D1EE124